jgi:hypothetical protein
MRIGIISSGRLGGILAQLFGEAGHEIAIADSRGPGVPRDKTQRLDGRVRWVSVLDAARFGDVVVLAIPFGRHTELPAVAFAGRTVIDTTNYEPERDGRRPELDTGRTTSSQLLQARMPWARVVKAFNTIHWRHLRDFGRQSSAQRRYGVPVAGDDPGAKRRVFDLVEQLGFEPVDSGGLAAGGRRQQPGTPVYAIELEAGELRALLGVGSGGRRWSPPAGRRRR